MKIRRKEIYSAFVGFSELRLFIILNYSLLEA